MPENHIRSFELSRIENHPINLDIDFSLIPEIKFSAKEIRNCKITGSIGPQHDFNRCNFVTSRLNAVNAFEANFDNIDFKDCIVLDSTFRQSHFPVGAIAGCFITETRFIECSYRDQSMTETEFRNVLFDGCDLSKMLIKDCRFINCIFRKCKTTNKLFEASLIVDCKFESIELEFGTVLSNFGITKAQMTETTFRDVSIFDMDVPIQDYLARLSDITVLTEVERFRLSYFVDPDSSLCSPEFDRLLSSEAWKTGATIPRFLLSNFEGFVDFLLHIYDRGSLHVFAIWRIHSVTAELASAANTSPDMVAMLYKPLMGIQMTLARLLENQIELFERLLARCENTVTFLAEGPLERKYFESKLDYVFANSSAKITRLVPHNSPSELTIIAEHIHDIGPFIALFICSRISFEINKLGSEVGKDRQTPHRNEHTKLHGATQTSALSSFSLSIGLTDRQRAYEIKLLTALPGNYFLQFMVQLRLDVPSKTIAKTRDILVGIIFPDK